MEIYERQEQLITVEYNCYFIQSKTSLDNHQFIYIIHLIMTKINTMENKKDHDINLRETIDHIEICESMVNEQLVGKMDYLWKTSLSEVLEARQSTPIGNGT